ncbi:MAG: VWA domain-containing protein [Planctomycetes bacterium]|nr:VWA domain-containing protein [Planctomycetota bacterium]
MGTARSRLFPVGLVIVAIVALVSALQSKSKQNADDERTREEEAADAAHERELAARPPEEGIALAIVYDTSGSMKDAVPSGSGKGQMEPKYVIANRALAAIVDRLEAVAASGTPEHPKRIDACLVTFRGKHGHIAVPLGRFDGNKLRPWIHEFSAPEGPTPLGDAVRIAGRAVLDSNLTHKHVLILTDGENTETLDPTSALSKLKIDATRRGTSLAAHFVAFDVDARVFNGVKRLGATVVGAADEKQLGSQLEFILEKKILLEAEELPPPKSETNK